MENKCDWLSLFFIFEQVFDACFQFFPAFKICILGYFTCLVLVIKRQYGVQLCIHILAAITCRGFLFEYLLLAICFPIA